jgi:hypothetical protein
LALKAESSAARSVAAAQATSGVSVKRRSWGVKRTSTMAAHDGDCAQE